MKPHKLTRRYLLTQVKKLILEEPKRMDMMTLLECNRISGPACGTVGCIAGWTLIVANLRGKKTFKEVASTLPRPARLERASKLLHLNFSQEQSLFFVDQWPKRLALAYSKAVTPEAIARVTCKRIDLFLKSGGRK